MSSTTAPRQWARPLTSHYLLATHFYGNMGKHMKTTIELPDDLLIQAKKKAAESRTTLRALFERGLRRELAGSEPAGKPRRRSAIRWVTAKGGLPPGTDLSDRAAMRERFGRKQ